MTTERYLKWRSDIAQARADDDTKKLESLQLDYNLELGECLSHQSQRTKDIKSSIDTMQDDIVKTHTAIDGVNTIVDGLEESMKAMATSVDSLAKSVSDLVTYRNGLSLKVEGARSAGKFVSAIACGIAIITGWAYAIYQALRSCAN